MTLLILSRIIISVFISTLLTFNPVSMGLLILLIALFRACILRIILSSWIAFILFIIYISGMLVIFSYFVALTPNQPSIKITYIITPNICLSLILLTYLWPSSQPITATSAQENLVQFLFLTHNLPILIFLILLLFITIVFVVKLSDLSKGPLRGFISYV